MPGPRYVTSDNYGAAGVYVKERNPPVTVRGEFNSIVGINGECVRGPANVVVGISNSARLEAVFGGRDYVKGGPLKSEVWKAVLNKPFGKLQIVRTVAADATAATQDFNETATPIWDVAASSPGAWADGLTVEVLAATSGLATQRNVVAKWRAVVQTWKNLDTSVGLDNLEAVMGTDYANLITITKLADGTPDVAAAAVLSTAGSDGAIADADFTAAGGGMTLLNKFKGIKAWFVAGRSNAAIKAMKNTLAAAANDRAVLICPDSEVITKAAFEAEVAGYTRDDRLWACFNHARTLDTEAAVKIWTEPTAWMASIISQTDPDIHIGDADNKSHLAGITELYYEAFDPIDYDDFKAAGISALERDGGFVFVDAVTTDLTPGKTEIARRRAADFLVDGFAAYLKHSVKKPNTPTRREANQGNLSGWLRDLWRQERYVDSTEDGRPAFKIDIEALNTVNQRSQGVEKTLAQVKLLGHMLDVVLEHEIGTSVVIAQS